MVTSVPTGEGQAYDGPYALAERDGPVLHVRLNRPDRLNAVSEELYDDLEAAFSRATDPEVRAVLLTGAGRAFCAGADLKTHASRSRTAAEQRAYIWAGHRACRRVVDLDKPVVAAIHGHAIGAGAELALSADVLLAATATNLRLPEVALGTFVGGGITHRLPLLVGQLRAKQLLLLGRSFSAEEAASWGLVAEVVGGADLVPRATELTQELAGLPAVSLAAAKRGLNLGPQRSFEDALVFEADALEACLGSVDWTRGVQGFRRQEVGR